MNFRVLSLAQDLRKKAMVIDLHKFYFEQKVRHFPAAWYGFYSRVGFLLNQGVK